jgi:uncharacterized protein YbaR (Trm112 family)
MEAELTAFAESKDQRLEITVPDPQIRATIHEWARGKGFLARTRYEASELSEIKCRSCGQWFPITLGQGGSNFDVESEYGDATTICPHCNETVGWYNDREYMLDFPKRFRFIWKSTGQMLLLKSTGIPYKRSRNSGYNYRKHYKHPH